VILVTGATGFVGAEILRRASARGWRVRGLSRRPECAEELGRLPHVELFRSDVGDPVDLDEALEGVKTVIHLVGIIVATREQSFEKAHIVGTKTVLEATVRAGVRRYVHMSALGVEAGRGLSEYYRTKWAAEETVRASDVEATVLRPSIIFGPGDDFVNQLARVVRLSPVVPLPGGGTTRFQPVWVGDVAECFLQAARMDSTPQPVYDVVGPEILSLREIVNVLANAMGRRRKTVAVPIGPLRVGAAIAERVLPRPPLTRDQLAMLAWDNTTDPESVARLLQDFELEHAGVEEKMPGWLIARSAR
jgi:NADH dehydrogenase